MGKKGNYWSDYKEKYPDAKKQPFKGIWDTPYEIEGGDNKDTCPLLKQWPDPYIVINTGDHIVQSKFVVSETSKITSKSFSNSETLDGILRTIQGR